VGFVVDEVPLGQVSFEYFGFPPLPNFIPPVSPQSPSPIIRGWYKQSEVSEFIADHYEQVLLYPC
jgi:hypothetical protein